MASWGWHRNISRSRLPPMTGRRGSMGKDKADSLGLPEVSADQVLASDLVGLNVSGHLKFAGSCRKTVRAWLVRDVGAGEKVRTSGGLEVRAGGRSEGTAREGRSVAGGGSRVPRGPERRAAHMADEDRLGAGQGQGAEGGLGMAEPSDRAPPVQPAAGV